eukprot:46360_1
MYIEFESFKQILIEKLKLNEIEHEINRDVEKENRIQKAKNKEREKVDKGIINIIRKKKESANKIKELETQLKNINDESNEEKLDTKEVEYKRRQLLLVQTRLDRESKRLTKIGKEEEKRNKEKHKMMNEYEEQKDKETLKTRKK